MIRRVVIPYILLGMAGLCFASTPDRIVLTGEDADIKDSTISYWKEDHHLGHWSRPQDIIRFQIDALEAGTYRTVLKYACPDAHGGKVSIRFNDQEFQRTFGATGSWNKTMNKFIGIFEHSGGSVNIDLCILKQNDENQIVIDLHELVLEKEPR